MIALVRLTIDDIAALWVTPTPDLGTHEADQVRVCEAPVLAHIAAALGQARTVTAGDMVAARTNSFQRAPDPSSERVKATLINLLLGP